MGNNGHITKIDLISSEVILVTMSWLIRANVKGNRKIGTLTSGDFKVLKQDIDKIIGREGKE